MTADEQHARVFNLHHHRPRTSTHGTSALDPRGDADDSLPLVVDAAATPQADPPPVGPGAEPPRLQTRRLGYRWVRPRKRARGRTHQGPPTPDELATRDRARSKRARRYAAMRRTAYSVVRRTGRGGVVIVRGTARGIGHFAWQPELGALYRAMDDTNAKARNMADLYRGRLVRIGLLLGGAGGVWLAWPLLGPWLDDRVLGGENGRPLWQWLLAVAVLAGGAWVFGRIAEAEEQQAADDQLPPGLTAGMGSRAVETNFRLAFEALKIEGQVQVAHIGGNWGWIVTTDILSDFGRTELDRLARRLDTPRGGLLVSSPRDSSRARVFTVVLADLLSSGQAAVQHPHLPLSVPRVLARRFDGGELGVPLAGLHIAVFGRTGSGKSTVLKGFIDAFASARAVIGAIDMTGGFDLRAWEQVFDPRLCAFGDDVTATLIVLERIKAIAMSRKQRTPAGAKWASTEQDPPIRIVIDEYGVVAANSALRELLNWIILYGRNVDCHLLIASHRKVADIMGDGTVGSQVQCKVYLAMDADDVRTLPKAVRDQGVAPERLIPANADQVNDASKGYVVGLQDPAPLVRFNSYEVGEDRRRAAAYAKAGLGQLSAADVEAMVQAENARQDVPELLTFMEQAITSLSNGRTPPRATTEEIVGYLNRHGFPNLTVQNLTAQVREALGPAFPEQRRQDTNLHGRNQKGWYLEDLKTAIGLLTEMRKR